MENEPRSMAEGGRRWRLLTAAASHQLLSKLYCLAPPLSCRPSWIERLLKAMQILFPRLAG